MAIKKDNREYYDAMAGGYERLRHEGYHLYLDDAEVATVASEIQGRDVLEVGCGTGLIMSRMAPIAKSVVGIDLSGEMLAKASARGLAVVQASALNLPFPDNTFDVAVSFKVLPHIENIRGAIDEMARVVKPGGLLAMEFYNRHSIRSLIKALKSPSAVSDGVDDTDVFTRYDSLVDVAGLLPDGAKIIKTCGIRVAIPVAGVMKNRMVASFLGPLDRALGRTPLGRLGGFLVVMVRLAG